MVRIAAALALLGICVAGHATELDLPAQRLAAGTHLSLDELLNHPHWQQAPVFDAFVERTPVNGGTPTYATSVRVLLGDHDLYVAVRAFDPQPALIRARLGPHDSVGTEQDQIMVYVDSVGSRKAAQFFVVNPFGAKADGMYTSDTDSEDFAPDYDFEVRTRRDAEGYTAVFRLPFSTLRFASSAQGAWRMLVRRLMPREVAYEFTSVLIPSSAHDKIISIQAMTGVDTPTSAAFLRLTPGVSATDTVTRVNDVRVNHEQQLSASLDLKWRPLPEVVVDATVHPDFSQVELDVPQLSGNTRFALSFDEKRPFFQESSDLWQMPTTQLYTRAVTAPDWGLRATRRTDQFAGTLFVSDDRGGGVVLLPGTWGTGYAEQPASTVAATRLRWDARLSHVAVMGMQRRYEQGRGENTVVGTDFSHKFTPGLQLRGQVLGSQTTAQPDAEGRLTEAESTRGDLLWLSLNQRADSFESSIRLERVSEDFRNDLGFIGQSGLQIVTADANRIWRNRGAFSEAWLYMYGSHAEALNETITVYQFLRPGIFLLHNNGMELTVEPRVFELQRVEPTTELGRERYLHVELIANPAKLVPRLIFTVDAGRMTDFVLNKVITAHRAALEVEALPTRRMSITGRYDHQGDGVFSSGQYQESALQLKVSYALTATQELRAIATRRHLHRTIEFTEAQPDTLEERGDTLSLSYKYLRSRYRALYLGVTRGRAAFEDRHEDVEAYLKVVYALEL